MKSGPYHKTGFSSDSLLTQFFHSENSGETDSPLHPRGSVYFNNLIFSSLSEAVCGTLLELFVPGYRLINGETFQVPFGNQRTVDFMVCSTLVEFHQPQMYASGHKCADFNSRYEYEEYRRALGRARGNEWRVQKLIESTRSQLQENYYRRRRSQLNQHRDFREYPLIVAGSAEEFREFILIPFGSPGIPNSGELEMFFQHLVKVIAKESCQYRKNLIKHKRPLAA